MLLKKYQDICFFFQPEKNFKQVFCDRNINYIKLFSSSLRPSGEEKTLRFETKSPELISSNAKNEGLSVQLPTTIIEENKTQKLKENNNNNKNQGINNISSPSNNENNNNANNNSNNNNKIRARNVNTLSLPNQIAEQPPSSHLTSPTTPTPILKDPRRGSFVADATAGDDPSKRRLSFFDPNATSSKRASLVVDNLEREPRRVSFFPKIKI